MFSFTQHGSVRAAQRSIKERDLEIIMSLGSEVADGYLMRECDCQAAERELKQQLKAIRRLKGKRLVVKDGRLVTVFHASEREVSEFLGGPMNGAWRSRYDQGDDFARKGRS